MSDDHKFFAFKEGAHWRVNDLLPVDQIRSMLQTLEWKYEVFASIQTYDEHGNIKCCPLYFDLDGEPDQVLADAKAFCQTCEFVLNITPRIYFSGSKGFHLIIEKAIDHPRCHELVADFAKEIAGSIRSVDKKVYSSRRMFRIPCSPASKRGFYKIELLRRELFDLSFDQIRDLARHQRIIETEHDPSKLDDDTYESWLAIAIAQLPTYDKVGRRSDGGSSVDMEMTPCIATMLSTRAGPGDRNQTVYILAKFFRICEIDEASCRAILLQYQHWHDFEKEGGEVTKVVRSVYRNPRPSMIGCRGQGIYQELMRAQCAAPCHFRPDFDHMPFPREDP